MVLLLTVGTKPKFSAVVESRDTPSQPVSSMKFKVSGKLPIVAFITTIPPWSSEKENLVMSPALEEGLFANVFTFAIKTQRIVRTKMLQRRVGHVIR